jgi:DNA-binding PadR family transcriptional regulator
VKAETLKGHLDSLLLAVVAEEPAHGYRVIERLRERSGGAFDLPEGTVYPALHRLEAAGLLASSWASAAGRKRRVYRLTRKGRGALRSSRADWRAFSGAIEAVLA